MKFIVIDKRNGKDDYIWFEHSATQLGTELNRLLNQDLMNKKEVDKKDGNSVSFL